MEVCEPVSIFNSFILFGYLLLLVLFTVTSVIDIVRSKKEFKKMWELHEEYDKLHKRLDRCEKKGEK